MDSRISNGVDFSLIQKIEEVIDAKIYDLKTFNKFS